MLPDLIPLVVEQITSKSDLYRCSLVSRAFRYAVTPVLYRSLETNARGMVCDIYISMLPVNSWNADDSGIEQRSLRARRVIHPSITLLKQPMYANFVHRISETGKFYQPFSRV